MSHRSDAAASRPRSAGTERRGRQRLLLPALDGGRVRGRPALAAPSLPIDTLALLLGRRLLVATILESWVELRQLHRCHSTSASGDGLALNGNSRSPAPVIPAGQPAAGLQRGRGLVAGRWLGLVGGSRVTCSSENPGMPRRERPAYFETKRSRLAGGRCRGSSDGSPSDSAAALAFFLRRRGRRRGAAPGA